MADRAVVARSQRDCMLAAHRELLERLLDAVDQACEAERDLGERPRVALRTLLALLAADPPATRLLTIEILAAGPEGVEHRDAAVEALAQRLWVGESDVDRPPPNFSWITVAGMLTLIGHLVTAGAAVRLPDLEDELAGRQRG